MEMSKNKNKKPYMVYLQDNYFTLYRYTLFQKAEISFNVLIAYHEQ